MSFQDTFNEMVVILFAVGIGYLAHRLGYLGGEINQKLSKLILNITTPALMFRSPPHSVAVTTWGKGRPSFHPSSHPSR